MKIIKTASGRNKIKLSRKEWEAIGKKAGWGNDSWKVDLLETIPELKRELNDFEYVLQASFDIFGSDDAMLGIDIDEQKKTIYVAVFDKDNGEQIYDASWGFHDDSEIANKILSKTLYKEQDDAMLTNEQFLDLQREDIHGDYEL